MTVEGKYANLVATVKQECKDADENEIIEEFRRYEEEFLCLLYTSPSPRD